MRLFITVCNSQDWVYGQFFWSFVQALANCEYEYGVYRGAHPWDVVRNNQAIDKFLHNNSFDVLVKMDADQTYPADYFRRMVPLVEEYKVIGPMIYDRHHTNGYFPLVFQSKDILNLNAGKIAHQRVGIGQYPYTHTNNFYDRDVLAQISPPWYEARLSEDGLERANHVDYDFLDKIKDAGYPIYLNHDVVVGHIETRPVNDYVYERWSKGDNT